MRNKPAHAFPATPRLVEPLPARRGAPPHALWLREDPHGERLRTPCLHAPWRGQGPCPRGPLTPWQARWAAWTHPACSAETRPSPPGTPRRLRPAHLVVQGPADSRSPRESPRSARRPCACTPETLRALVARTAFFHRTVPTRASTITPGDAWASSDRASQAVYRGRPVARATRVPPSSSGRGATCRVAPPLHPSSSRAKTRAGARRGDRAQRGGRQRPSRPCGTWSPRAPPRGGSVRGRAPCRYAWRPSRRSEGRAPSGAVTYAARP